MKIAIAGYGVEGKSSYQYYRPKGDVTIADEREEVADLPEGVPAILGPDAFSRLADFDLIIRSPSINPKKLPYNGTVWSATNEFFKECAAPIIGVTGTKGKGTTSSLVASILRAAGKTVHLVGNIGIPVLDELPKIQPDHIVVFELSSFQLWDATRSPQVAVVLMVEPDHQDIHADMDDYVSAKANIRRFQAADEPCYYHPTNPYSKRIALIAGERLDSDGNAEAENWQKSAYRYASKESVFVKDGFFVDTMDTKLAPVSALNLPGLHNIENACAAIAAARHFTLDKMAFEKGLAAFMGLDHRLKLVGEAGGVKFYDDSIATTPGSAIAALRSFDRPKTIILGGSDKGAQYDELIDECAEKHASVVAIGQTGKKIAELCREKGVIVKEVGAAPMDEIVAAALELATAGSVVILSPASASFDMFKDYGDRGNQFIASVRYLGAK